jgi:general stress protein YciG
MEQVKSNRGFASMDRARQREIASKGGHGVPPEKRSFSKNRQLAAEAGKKGGEAVPAAERSFSQNRELAAAAGRKGGESRAMLFSTMGHKRNARREHDEDEEEKAEETEPADAHD